MLLGFVHLPHPLGGDQALFLLGAQELDRGATLYRDFWDLKQPGVYLFFWLGGKLFGFTEYGVHVFEWLYLTAFALVLTWTARACLSRWATAVAPLAVAGSYYLISTPWSMTQVEFLAAFPIYCALWCMCSPWRTLRGRMLGNLAAGSAAAVAAMFKLAFLPILLVAGLAGTLWVHGRDENSWHAIVVQRWLMAAVGFAVTSAPAVMWLAVTGGLDGFLWTTFTYPVEAMRAGGSKSVTVLLDAIQWFVVRFGVWLTLACLALWQWTRKRVHLFPLLLAVWLVCGLGVIAVQRISWWPYHFQLLIAPAVLLGLYGLDKAKPRWWIACIAIGAAFAPGAALMARKAQGLEWSAAWNRREAVLAYQRSVFADYDQIWRDTRFLIASEAQPGPIYVFGNPLYLLLGNRKQAIAQNGWGWDTAAPSQWEALPSELGVAQPAYVFVDAGYLPMLRRHGGNVLELLGRNYSLDHADSAGQWYRSKSNRLGSLQSHAEVNWTSDGGRPE